MITADLDKVCKGLSGPSVILSDFSLQHPVWGARCSSRESDMFLEWLTISPFCIINTICMTHIAPGATSSLIYISLSLADLHPKIPYTVEDDTWHNDHFPVQLTLSLTPPDLRPRTQYHWSSTIAEMNQALFSMNKMDYSSFLSIIQTAMNNHNSRTNCSHKGFPAWWTTLCSNLRHQKSFYLKRPQRGAS